MTFSSLLALAGPWLADLFLQATLVLIAILTARCCLRQPVRRVLFAWGGFAGLGLFVCLTAIPHWPRQTLNRQMSLGLVHVGDQVPPVIDSGPSFESASTPFVVSTSTVVADRDATRFIGDDFDNDPNQPADLDQIEPFPTSIAEPVSLSKTTALSPAALPPVMRFESLPWWSMAAAVWSAGSVLAMGWIFAGHWQTRKLIRRSRAAPAWVSDQLQALVPAATACPRLRVSDQVGTAVALGTLWPAIILPQATISPSNIAAVRAALAHELAHLRHGDLWLLALERVLLPVYYAHPLYWLLRRRTRADQEILADAAAAGQSPIDYAAALLAFAKATAKAPALSPLGTLALWTNSGTLTRRIEMILDPQQPVVRTTSRLWRGLTLFVVFAMIVGISLFTIRPRPTEDEQTEPSLLAGEKFADAVLTAIDSASDDDSKVFVELESGRLQPNTGNSRIRLGNEADDTKSESGDVAHALPISPNPTLADAAAAEPRQLVIVQALVARINPAALKEAETSLSELISDATDTDTECHIKSGHIMTTFSPENLQPFLRNLSSKGAVKILSEPQITTLVGQTARVQIADEITIHEVDNGNESSVTAKYPAVIGIALTIKPAVLQANDPFSEPTLSLEMVLNHKRLISLGSAEDAVPNLPRIPIRKTSVGGEIESGRTFVWAQRPSKAGLKQADPDLLLVFLTPRLVVQPQEILPSPQETKSTVLPVGNPSLTAPRADDQAVANAVARRSGQNQSEPSDSDASVLRDVIRELKEELKALRESRDTHDAARTRPAGNANPDLQPALPAKRNAVDSHEMNVRTKLLRLDVREAELDYAAAETVLQEGIQLNSRGALGASELAVRRSALDKAQIALERAKIRLEAVAGLHKTSDEIPVGDGRDLPTEQFPGSK